MFDLTSCYLYNGNSFDESCFLKVFLGMCINSGDILYMVPYITQSVYKWSAVILLNTQKHLFFF